MRTDNPAPWGLLASSLQPCSPACSRCRRRPPPAPSRASSTARCRRRRGRRRSRCTTASSSRRAATAPARSSARAGSSPPATASRTTPATNVPPGDWNYTADAAKSRVGSIARTSGGTRDHRRSGHPPRELQRHDARSRPRAAAPRVGRARGAAAADRQRRASAALEPRGPGDGHRLGRHRRTAPRATPSCSRRRCRCSATRPARDRSRPAGARSSRRRRWCAPAAAAPTPAGATPAGRS